MSFYVALGPRGLLFRAGMIVIGVMGSVTYWRGSRRRPAGLTPWSGPDFRVTHRPFALPNAPDDRTPATPIPADH